MSKDEESIRAFYVLAGYELCHAKGCNHIRRGYRDPNGKVHWAPGIYCQCCIDPYTDDAYTCNGEEINVKV